MRLLDRHIAGRYLSNVTLLFIVLFSFVVVIDVSLNLRGFVDVARKLRPGAGGVEQTLMVCWCIVDLWGPRLLQLFNYLTGVVLVGAMGFTCSQFVKRREFVAVLASGVSLHRLALPIIAVAGMVIGLGALNQEFALPGVAALLPRNVDEAGQRSIRAFRVPLVKDSQGRLFYAASFDAGAGVMKGVHIWERDEQGVVTRRIAATSATWDGDGWRLEEGVGEKPDQPGQQEPVARIDTDLEPTVVLVNQISGYADSLSWREINRTLSQGARLDEGARRTLDRVRFGRLSVMVSDLLVLVISLPFFLVRVPRSMAIQSLKCAPLAMAAMIGAVLGASTPLPGLPTWIGVFVPCLVLLPLALWAILSVRS